MVNPRAVQREFTASAFVEDQSIPAVFFFIALAGNHSIA
jgi:hypothetical protein